jgi:exodeoxyribonuclease VII large subunit
VAEPSTLVWSVGDLCHAVADALQARFNPVAVRGEISGLSRASSGHCYFSLKDAAGQLRCAMFKRAAGLLAFAPRDGDLVEVRGRLGVYEPRGDLQLIVESMRQAGAGALFDEFLRRKARLQAEGLFDVQRKRSLPTVPRAIGVVTSLGAAAWHDVVTALRRRLPHVPVLLAPAAVQGASAPAQLVQALEQLYQRVQSDGHADAAGAPVPDVILLVRGGGSMEDLWAFNDEALARTIARSPVPIICGVGHETDFTIADFVADLRAPTPTAAAELVAPPREVWLGALDLLQDRLRDAVMRRLDTQSQRLDKAAHSLGRPSSLAAGQRIALLSCARRLRLATHSVLQRHERQWQDLAVRLPAARDRALDRVGQRLERSALRLQLLDPALVLQRGYAWITDAHGRAVTHPAQAGVGDRVRATLAHGSIDLRVIAKE